MVVYKNVASGFCYDANMTGSGGWDESHLWPCDENNTNQNFRWEDGCLKVGNRHAKYYGETVGVTTRGSCDKAKWNKDDLTIRFDDKSGYCVDAAGRNQATRIKLWGCNNGDFQKWVPMDLARRCDQRNIGYSSGNCKDEYIDSCDREWNVWESKCDKEGDNPGSGAFLFKKRFCNANLDNAKSDKCINWCKKNNSECETLNNALDCVKYGYCTTNDPLCSACTPSAIVTLKSMCEKRGIKSEQGLTRYACTVKGLEDLETDCKNEGIQDLELCTIDKLNDIRLEKTNQQQLELAAELARKSQENYNKTQDTILYTLGLSDSPPMKPSNSIFDMFTNSTVVIALVVVFILILCSSSSGALILL